MFSDQVQKVAQSLLRGEKLLLRGLCFSGKTHFLDDVVTCLSSNLGIQAIRIDAKTTLKTVDSLLERVDSSVSDTGFCVVVVDDFDLILHSNPEGIEIENRLNGVCVDAHNSQCVGIIVSAQKNSILHINSAKGSPLVASLFSLHIEPRNLVSTSEQELRLFRQCGFIEPLRLIAEKEANGVGLTTADHASVSFTASRISAEISQSDASRLNEIIERQKQGKPTRYTDADSGLFPLISQLPDHHDLANIPEIIKQTDILDLVIGIAPWPTYPPASARRFLARVGREIEVYWVDKYIGQPFSRLVDFLQNISLSLTQPLTLNLLSSSKGIPLGSETGLQLILHPHIPNWLMRRLRIRLRVMQPTEEVFFHDRQITFVRRPDGFALPPFDRIVSATTRGNTIDHSISMTDYYRLLGAWASANTII